MIQELEQLKELVFNGDFDTASKQSVLALERRLQDIAVKEKMADTEPFKTFLDWAADRITQAQLLLQNDRTLTDRQRDALFERIDDCDHLLQLFGRGSAKAAIEQSIREALAAAKAA